MKPFILGSSILLRIRYAHWFLKTWQWFRPSARHHLQNQKHYYREILGKLRPGRHLALDIGANEGYVTDTFLAAGLSVVAVEPDPRNVRILNARFEHNARFKLYPCAVSGSAGMGTLYLQQGGAAVSTVSAKWKSLVQSGQYRIHQSYEQQPLQVPSITLDELVRVHGMFSLVKIDVEGNEEDCIRGLSQSIPLLLLEANLPEFLEETVTIVHRLSRLDPGIRFGFSSGFRMQPGDFIDAEAFCGLLANLSYRTIDVICRMSNYREYYSK